VSGCEALVANASVGVAPALRAVDCVAGQMTGAAFSRLFGAEGALAPALLILLTLYIAFFAVSLLTGRATLGISALTPRMLTVGLVLTFATSWVAYQGVLWNLATGAPDQIAGLLTGAQGSATQIFANRIDIVLAAIGAASEAAGGAQGDAQMAGSGTFTPANLMWLAALLLMLGTVGVLVTARIALAVLLAIGPVFVVMALFRGTRGLTAGWLRGVVLTALTPLFVTVGGGITLELVVPVVGAIFDPTHGLSGRAAMALFMISAIHVALMAMILKISGTMVSAWSVFGLGEERDPQTGPARFPAAHSFAPGVGSGDMAYLAPNGSRRAMPVPVTNPSADPARAVGNPPVQKRSSRKPVATAPTGSADPIAPLARQRARGIGSRFRASPSQIRQVLR